MSNTSRQKFREYWGEQRDTERVCPHEGCGKPARYVNGHYTVVHRRVRVWSCVDHYSGQPLREVPMPPSIAAALEAEKKHYENMEKRYRSQLGSDRSVSVKTMAPSGHGPRIPYDRALAFRWGA